MTRPSTPPHNADLEWFLNASEAALGARSSLSAFISNLERMGSSTEPVTDPYTDAQVGWGPWNVTGTIARERRIRSQWVRVSVEHRKVLVAYYLATAKVRVRGKAKDGSQDTWRRFPLAVEGELGRYAGVALWLAHEAGTTRETLRACERRKSQDLAPLLRRAENAASAAHEAFREAQRAQADEWAKGAA